MGLENDSNWQSIYNAFHPSPFLEKPFGRFHKILIPQSITQHTVRIYATSFSAKAEWWLAGDLIQLLGDNTNPDFEGSRHRIPLRRITLVNVPLLTSQYRLKFEPAFWLREIAIVIEVYVGNTAE
jgi:hypothetical protein